MSPESDKHINGLLIATNINRNVHQERKVLCDSNSYDQNTKDKIAAALIPDAMSSDESVIESDDDNDGDRGLHVPKKCL